MSLLARKQRNARKSNVLLVLSNGDPVLKPEITDRGVSTPVSSGSGGTKAAETMQHL